MIIRAQLIVAVFVLLLPCAAVSAEPVPADQAQAVAAFDEADLLLSQLETGALQGKAHQDAIKKVYTAIEPTLSDPDLSDVEHLYRLGRLAMVIGDASQPVPGDELAAVVAEALLRFGQTGDGGADEVMFLGLRSLTGERAIERVASRRKFHANTIGKAVQGDIAAQRALASLYDSSVASRHESPVVRHEAGVIHWLEQAIAQEDPEAMRMLAVHYLETVGAAKKTEDKRLDIAEALLRKAVGMGYWDAENHFWQMINTMRVDVKTMGPIRKDLAKRGAEGDAIAKHMVGLMMRRGWGGPRDHRQARKLFEESFEAGVARSAVRLGAMTEYGEGGNKDGQAAVKWYGLAAEKGDKIGQFSVGNMRQRGHLGTKYDPEEAIEWYKKSAAQGHVESMDKLGFLYALGRGVPKDKIEAERWYRLAAEQGSGISALNLGHVFYYGQGFEKDYFEAMMWYEKADARGCRSGQAIGEMYELGRGVEIDFKKAAKWYRSVSFPDFTTIMVYNPGRAQMRLGWLYAEGKGVKQDYKQAVKMFRMAINQNSSTPAMYSLGKMFEDGTGVEQDKAKAIAWYQKAASRGSDEARERLEALGELEAEAAPEDAVEEIEGF